MIDALAAGNPGLPLYRVDADSAKLSAAWLIDRCGFRGFEGDGVAVSARHALVLVHRGGGQAKLLALAEQIRAAVQARFGVELEMEPTAYRDE